jgi:hypothetical protein
MQQGTKSRKSRPWATSISGVALPSADIELACPELAAMASICDLL